MPTEPKSPEVPALGNGGFRVEDISADAANSLIDDVRRAMGLRVRHEAFDRLLHWTADRMRAKGLRDIDRYIELLAADGAAGDRERQLIAAHFTTADSYFFRDAGQFDLLATTILPELIERRATQRALRIWSAGCATGEEPHSVAMLIAELGPRLDGWKVEILGTDIDPEALETARHGVFGDRAFRALDAARKQRHFESRGGGRWEIAPHLRRMVSFRTADLVRDRFPHPPTGLAAIDLILCRDVFIHLDDGVVDAITRKFAATLAGGGYLVTAHSELFGHVLGPLAARPYPQSTVLQKTAEAAPVFAPEPALPAPVLPPPAAAAPHEDALVQSAWRQANGGHPDAAERDCQTAIALASRDPRPYYMLAQLAQERGDLGHAKGLLNKVVYLDPSFVAAHLELAALQANAGDDERARHSYDAARRALRKLPSQRVVAPYGERTVADVLAYLERRLGTVVA